VDSDAAYAELGLAPGASEEEVKAAWRRLVSRWHPDRNATHQAVDRMQRINRAYEHIRGWFEEAPSTAPSPRDEAPQADSPRTTRRKVRLTLEEAALGCVKLLRGRLACVCQPCAGRGEHELPGACPACKGQGSVRRSSWWGWMSTSEACGTCHGDGRARLACRHCAGSGRHISRYSRRVRIPAGARHGDVLHAQGSIDDPAGTLELHIALQAHPLFVLGDDGILRCEMPVNGFAWIAGCWIDVPTLTGRQKLRLRRGHHAYRLRAQGFPVERRGERGDYIVSVLPTFPTSLSAEQEALLDRLAAEDGGNELSRAWERKMMAWEQGLSKAMRSSSDPPCG
jgi:molecular chaperone DnaJ